MVRATVAAMKMLGALMCVVLVFTAGCSEDKKAVKPKTTTTRPAPTTTIDPARVAALLDATKAMDELKVKLKATPELTRATVGLEVITVEVRQPNNPKNVDTYRYTRREPVTPAEIARAQTGTGEQMPFEWGDPTPVKIKTTEIAKLPGVIFSPGEVAWSRIPSLAKEALKILGEIEQPRVDKASVAKGADTAQINISIPVDGIRGSGSLRADNKGVIISAKRQ